MERLVSNLQATSWSNLKLKDGLKNVVKWGIANPHQAVMMASLIPAKSVHIDDVCGRLKRGYDADFIVLNDDLDLIATYLMVRKGLKPNHTKEKSLLIFKKEAGPVLSIF